MGARVRLLDLRESSDEEGMLVMSTAHVLLKKKQTNPKKVPEYREKGGERSQI